MKDYIEKITGKRVRYYEDDVCDPIAVQKVFDENAIDAVIHFANLTSEAKRDIAAMQYDDQIQGYLEDDREALNNAKLRERLIDYSEQCDNAREISRLIKQTFSLFLIEKLISESYDYTDKRVGENR